MNLSLVPQTRENLTWKENKIFYLNFKAVKLLFKVLLRIHCITPTVYLHIFEWSQNNQFLLTSGCANHAKHIINIITHISFFICILFYTLCYAKTTTNEVVFQDDYFEHKQPYVIFQIEHFVP